MKSKYAFLETVGFCSIVLEASYTMFLAFGFLNHVEIKSSLIVISREIKREDKFYTYVNQTAYIFS